MTKKSWTLFAEFERKTRRVFCFRLPVGRLLHPRCSFGDRPELVCRDMEGLIDSLNRDKWQEAQVSDKTDDFQEYHVNPHAHKKLSETSFLYMIDNDNVDPKKVVLEYALKDPIKNVSLLEIRLSADDKITGLDLDGDVVLLKQ